jgi:hypothetical protein
LLSLLRWRMMSNAYRMVAACDVGNHNNMFARLFGGILRHDHQEILEDFSFAMHHATMAPSHVSTNSVR